MARAEEGSLQLEETVLRAKAGDGQAFEALMKHYQDAVYRMIFYRVRSRTDAEDLSQEVFLKAFRNISHLKNNQRFAPWLFRIAVNHVRDSQRKQRLRLMFRWVFLDDPEDVETWGELPDPAQALTNLARQDFWRDLKTFLARLPTMEKEVFVLRFLDQLEIREIAEVLDRREGTIKTHLYRAVKKFRGESSLLRWVREEFHAD